MIDLVQLPAVLDSLESLGATKPEGLEAINDLHQALSDAVNHRDVGIDDLLAMVKTGELTRDNLQDSITDAIDRKTRRDFLVGATTKLNSKIFGRAKELLRDGADEILRSAGPALDQAVEAFKDSMETLGPDPDLAAVAKLGPIAGAAASQRAEADKVLQDIHGLRFDLAQAGYHSTRLTAAWYLVSVTGLDDLAKADQTMQNNSPASPIGRLIAAGYDVRLNTGTQSEELTRGAEKASRLAERKAQEAAGKADLEAGQREIERHMASTKPGAIR